MTTKSDYRQDITNNLVAMLEQGTSPWINPATGLPKELPLNPTTGKKYQGANAINLYIASHIKNYDDPRWMTYKQAVAAGGQVKKGEHATHIEFWDIAKKQELTEPSTAAPAVSGTAGEKKQLAPIHKIYAVFNASQIDGLPARPARTMNPITPHGQANDLIAATGAAIQHHESARAYYQPSTDTIHLPYQGLFTSSESYYSTALHELAHWSGSATRLNRESLTKSQGFGSPSYAKEELRAELASVFLAADLGIAYNAENHASYLASWIEVLKNDKNEIFRAASDAGKSANYIFDFYVEQELKLEAEKLAAGAASPQLLPVITKPIYLAAADQSVLTQEWTQAEAWAKAAPNREPSLRLADTKAYLFTGTIAKETENFLFQRANGQPDAYVLNNLVAHLKSNIALPLPREGDIVTIEYDDDKAVSRAAGILEAPGSRPVNFDTALSKRKIVLNAANDKAEQMAGLQIANDLKNYPSYYDRTAKQYTPAGNAQLSLELQQCFDKFAAAKPYSDISRLNYASPAVQAHGAAAYAFTAGLFSTITTDDNDNASMLVVKNDLGETTQFLFKYGESDYPLDGGAIIVGKNQSTFETALVSIDQLQQLQIKRGQRTASLDAVETIETETTAIHLHTESSAIEVVDKASGNTHTHALNSSEHDKRAPQTKRLSDLEVTAALCEMVGDKTKRYKPQKQSAIYKGKIILDTGNEYVQQLSPTSVIFHARADFKAPLDAHQNYAVKYHSGSCCVSKLPPVPEQGLGIDR